jgi:hypothetical protein
MSALTIEQALDSVYASLHNGNQDIDQHIIALKVALYAKGEKSVEIDPTKIPEPNRQGRKTLQSYFKKRGVLVTFAGNEAA